MVGDILKFLKEKLHLEKTLNDEWVDLAGYTRTGSATYFAKLLLLRVAVCILNIRNNCNTILWTRARQCRSSFIFSSFLLLPPLVKLFFPLIHTPDNCLCGWCISRTERSVEPCHAWTGGLSLELIQQYNQSNICFRNTVKFLVKLYRCRLVWSVLSQEVRYLWEVYHMTYLPP